MLLALLNDIASHFFSRNLLFSLTESVDCIVPNPKFMEMIFKLQVTSSIMYVILSMSLICKYKVFQYFLLPLNSGDNQQFTVWLVLKRLASGTY